MKRITVSWYEKKMLQTRFGSCEAQDNYCLSTILDPRFKNKVFSSQAEMHRSQEKLILKYEEILQSSTSERLLSSTGTLLLKELKQIN